jgi:hypothetical protein
MSAYDPKRTFHIRPPSNSITAGFTFIVAREIIDKASETISLQEPPQAFAATVVEVVSGVSRSTSNGQCGHTNFLGH